MYRLGQKSDTSRTLHYTAREVSLFLAHPVERQPVGDYCRCFTIRRRADPPCFPPGPRVRCTDDSTDSGRRSRSVRGRRTAGRPRSDSPAGSPRRPAVTSRPPRRPSSAGRGTSAAAVDSRSSGGRASSDTCSPRRLAESHQRHRCKQLPRPTQPPTLSGTANEYRLKCDDALRLGVKAGWLIPFVNKRVGVR